MATAIRVAHATLFCFKGDACLEWRGVEGGIFNWPNPFRKRRGIPLFRLRLIPVDETKILFALIR